MRESNPIEELRRRLIELGCPAKAVHHIVRETAEHLEDLQQAALGRGLTPAEAVTQAEQQLGDTAKLAEQHLTVLQRASWWGRHPLLGFMVLSSIAHPILLFAISGLLGFVFGFIEALRHVDFPIPYFKVCLGIACLSSSTLFYWAAQRSAMSLKWGLIACAIISVETLLLAESAILLAIPLLVTSLAYVLKRRAVKLALIHP